MPKKKVLVPENVLVTETVDASLPDAPKVVKTCEHVNKQFYGLSGRLEDLTCELTQGHKGDHYAKTMRKEPNPVVDNKGIVIQERYNEVEAEAYWGNMAETPVRDITEKPAAQLSLYQRDILATFLKKNPNVDEALGEARKSPLWNALSS